MELHEAKNKWWRTARYFTGGLRSRVNVVLDVKIRRDLVYDTQVVFFNSPDSKLG